MKIIILFFLVMASFLNAQAKSEAEFLPTDDRVMYYQLISMCSNNDLRATAEKSALWFNSFVNSGVIDMVTNKKFTAKNPFYDTSPELKNLVLSEGYFKAMNHCFGSDETKKALFFYSLLSLDIFGKSASWVMDLTFLRSVYWGIQGFTKSVKLTSSTLELTQRWLWFRYFYDVSLNQLKVFGIPNFKIIIPLMLTGTVSEFYSHYHKFLDEKSISSSFTPEYKEQVEKQIEYFKQLRLKTTQQQDLETIDMFIKKKEELLSNFN